MTDKKREIDLYKQEMGELPPEHEGDDWQWTYRGTPEEKQRLKAWMGYEDDEQQPHELPQINQDESLF